MNNLKLVGASPRFRSLLHRVEMVAPVDATVLLQGETGTGKEVLAQAIHQASPRRKNRFVAVNCAAIPSALLESELFGHERGAFTGAISQSLGRFQTADRGTLFLDEIGDLPMELQPKLLRALQEKQFERLGGGHPINVDLRVIAATNQDLWRMVQERQFRADLYYRLNVFPIAIPPLRERQDDIPILAEYFVQKFAAKHGKAIQSIPDDVMAALRHHEWPGNIRELQNVIERGVILTVGPTLSLETTEHLTKTGANPAADTTAVRTLADAERAHITAALRSRNWVIGGPNGAAAQLGVPRTTLIYRMERLGISNGLSSGRRRASARPAGNPALSRGAAG